MKQAGEGVGKLYVVATPIGNLADITQRAVATLQDVDLIAAEDTRHSARLLQHLGVQTPMVALHDFNEAEKLESILSRLQSGQAVALISDAGTPLISDPGYRLVKEALGAGYQVIPIPGASSLTAALSVAGVATDRFVFEGFLPAKTAGRLKLLGELVRESRTLIFFEAPHRILSSLEDMKAVFGDDRHVVLAKELTKHFETVHGGTLAELIPWLQADSDRQRGEFVILVQGAVSQETELDDATIKLLQVLMSELPLKQAASLTARISGKKKNLLYQYALSLKPSSEGK